MAHCSDLPPELIALIIDFNHDAQSTLRQCSLVCRTWLSPSQRLLFHTFQWFELERVVPFRDFLLGASELGAYIREVSIYRRQEAPESKGTDREGVQGLFSLLPNITKIKLYFLASSPFLFSNAILRQCSELCKLTIAPARGGMHHVISPAALMSNFQDTTVKNLQLRLLELPSTIDSPLDLDVTVCSVERLTLDSPGNLAVWFPYFRRILPNWSEFKILCVQDNMRPWGNALQTCDLSHLHRLHVRVFIREFSSPCSSSASDMPSGSNPHSATRLFTYNEASPLFSSASAPKMDHLLLTLDYAPSDDIAIEVVSSMVEWYRCTLAALSQGKESTLKNLTLTVMALNDPAVATAWAKVDDVLSTDTFSRLECVHFFDRRKRRIEMLSCPSTVRMLQQVLPKLWRGGKLAV